MYLMDANIVLELLYKRRWKECYELLNKVKVGVIKTYL